jgi:hypothetical protein
LQISRTLKWRWMPLRQTLTACNSFSRRTIDERPLSRSAEKHECGRKGFSVCQ